MRTPPRFAGLTIVAAVLLVGATSARGTQTPQQKCQAGKNRTAGKYAVCRQNAAAKLATTGDTVKYNAALDTCATSFQSAWQKLNAKAAKAGASCLDGASSAGNFQTVIGSCTDDIAAALAGGALPTCPSALASCQSDLATCQASVGATLLETNQTTCYDSVANTPHSCPGTGQDGEFQKGLARSYTDNGNGTITDNRTGLVWEKLADDDTFDDKDTTYTWADAFGKIQQLNTSPCFAGQCDWRLPNVNELHSILDYAGTSSSLLVAPVFNTGCTPGCTVTDCSCTAAGSYWSSTTYTESPDNAWEVLSDLGFVVIDFKVNNNFVRAVRGGA
jgi:hypothetical protein